MTLWDASLVAYRGETHKSSAIISQSIPRSLIFLWNHNIPKTYPNIQGPVSHELYGPRKQQQPQRAALGSLAPVLLAPTVLVITLAASTSGWDFVGSPLIRAFVVNFIVTAVCSLWFRLPRIFGLMADMRSKELASVVLHGWSC